MKLLIIDDNPADRQFYKKHIENCKIFPNIVIDDCNTLSKATERISEVDYDLIILDLGLPESDGMETIITTFTALKKKGDIPPVIVLTGLEDHIIGYEAFQYGVKDFLTKTDVLKNNKELDRSIKYATYGLNFKDKK